MTRRHLEDDIQMAVCNHLRWRAYPGVVWFAVPNGGKRNAREAARMKGMGVTAGVSDLIFLHAGEFYALELKTAEGRATNSQLDFLKAVGKAGGHYAIAYGIDDVLRVLGLWGLIRPEARAAA